MSAFQRPNASDQNPANPCPPEIFSRLVRVPVRFRSFRGREESGIMVVDEALADDVAGLFAELLKTGFPIESVTPISDPAFAWDDVRSMTANNSSGFNYRLIAGTERLSYHAFGKAIDINPAVNPYFHDGIVEPAGATYDPSRPGVLTEASPAVRFLDARGWEWGGRWKNPDYQHFQKT
jgi:peptidoglycan L-alanyl-D-glutamate endopeptidase CwlK